MARIDTVLDEVELETERFLKRLKAARKRISEGGKYIMATKENASLKRSALDLKHELTKITQSTTF